jgi:hypothetical protein
VCCLREMLRRCLARTASLTVFLVFPLWRANTFHCVTIVVSMTPSQGQPKFQLTNTADYREHYANSVQIRVNLWDFFLMFGTVNQTAPENVVIHNFQGIYLSPQQAKALLNILTQNISQYEATFGEIKLEPHGPSGAIQ